MRFRLPFNNGFMKPYAVTLLRAPDTCAAKAQLPIRAVVAVWPEGIIAQPVDNLTSAKWNLLHDTDGVYHILSWQGSRKWQRVRAFQLPPCRT